MEKNQTSEQRATLSLFLISFILGILGVYFNKMGGIPFALYGVLASSALSTIVLVKFRAKFVQMLGPVMTSGLAGLTLGAGLAMTGLWFVFQNPNKALLGPKWLVIGAVLLAAYSTGFKALQFKSAKPELTEEEIRQMSELERLKHIASSLSDEETFSPIKKAPMDAIAMSFIGIGLIMGLGVIVSTKSDSERWTMIAIIAVVTPVGLWLAIRKRQKSFGQINDILDDINVDRHRILGDVRTQIAEKEGHSQLPPPSN